MLDSSVWRRLPIAIFTLACCKLVYPVRISCALSIPLLATTWLFVARSRSEPYLYSLLGYTPPISRVGGGDTFSPQTRINRFVFLNLSILSLEVHLGVTASPHTPFPTGYITLPVHCRSLPLRLMPSHSRGQPFTRSILLVMKVFQSCSCPFSYFLLPSGSRHTVCHVPAPTGIGTCHAVPLGIALGTWSTSPATMVLLAMRPQDAVIAGL